jgi:hypothetical protein
MATRKKKASGKRTMRVRMYRHGLGDCFLLRLPKTGGQTFNILIDCGLIGVAKNPKPTMQKVVADISAECNKRVDVVVMTHEHWDHASGFSTEQAQAEFDQLDIGEAWYAWTEDPKNKLGRKLRREREAKLRALNLAVSAMAADANANANGMSALRNERVTSLLQFFGGPEADLAVGEGLGAAAKKPGKTRLAFEYPGKRPGIQLRYCYPNAEPITLPGVPGIRIYALGPPEDESMIKRSAPTKKGKEVYEFGADFAVAENLSSAFERLRLGDSGGGDGRDCPFDAIWAQRTGKQPIHAPLQNLIDTAWTPPSEAWRRIDDDWTAAAESLALNLDAHTNNTCLVLAFELVESGKVLLFAADAQVGNWLSWQTTRWSMKEGDVMRDVVGPDLLKRCGFYKVGHHGSHNATLRALGLEQMVSNELIAFIPVFKEQAEKNRWHAMPFSPLVTRLKEKTGGRVVFSDDKVAAPKGGDLAGLTKAQSADFLARLTTHKDFYEYAFDV